MTLHRDNTINKRDLIPNGRRLPFAPVHFTRVNFNPEKNRYFVSSTKFRFLSNWIWTNLEGRFYLCNQFVAFEDPTEATMFALSLTGILHDMEKNN